mmetsp:Transcript_145691/g.256919  ORF Transcript_145691/g.256919 Transcript_145691/m.256919 type:complete len:305 (-) Transcript_145691:92-1006(-)
MRTGVLAIVAFFACITCDAQYYDDDWAGDYNETEEEAEERRLSGNSTSSPSSPSSPSPSSPTPSSGGASGDPLATYGNKRIEFLLPVGVPTLLFENFYMKVFGTTFQGSRDEEQWIDRVIVTDKTDKKILDMSIKKDLMHFNRSTLAPNAFETLNIVMWDSRPTPLKVFPPADAYFYHAGVTVAFLRQNWDRERDAPNRECAWIGTALSKLVVCSASAREYFNEGFGGRKYAHLDLEFDDMHNEKGALSGLLPEVWGMVTPSETTRSYIKRTYEISEAAAAPGGSQNGSVDLHQASAVEDVVAV